MKATHLGLQGTDSSGRARPAAATRAQGSRSADPDADRLMPGTDGEDDFFDKLSPMSDAEMTQIVLTYLCSKVGEMSTESLRKFRTRCTEMQTTADSPGSAIEAIDWLLALREAGDGFTGRPLPLSRPKTARESRAPM
jgi:hypothetical protein